jgi:hypothetical protein
MHEDDGASRSRAHVGHFRVGSQCGYVIHDRRTGVERRVSDVRSRGIDCDAQTRMIDAQRLDHRYHSLDLLGDWNSDGPRPGGLTADLHDIGPLTCERASTIDGIEP